MEVHLLVLYKFPGFSSLKQLRKVCGVNKPSVYFIIHPVFKSKELIYLFFLITYMQIFRSPRMQRALEMSAMCIYLIFI